MEKERAEQRALARLRDGGSGGSGSGGGDVSARRGAGPRPPPERRLRAVWELPRRALGGRMA